MRVRETGQYPLMCLHQDILKKDMKRKDAGFIVNMFSYVAPTLKDGSRMLTFPNSDYDDIVIRNGKGFGNGKATLNNGSSSPPKCIVNGWNIQIYTSILPRKLMRIYLAKKIYMGMFLVGSLFLLRDLLFYSM